MGRKPPNHFSSSEASQDLPLVTSFIGMNRCFNVTRTHRLGRSKTLECMDCRPVLHAIRPVNILHIRQRFQPQVSIPNGQTLRRHAKTKSFSSGSGDIAKRQQSVEPDRILFTGNYGVQIQYPIVNLRRPHLRPQYLKGPVFRPLNVAVDDEVSTWFPNHSTFPKLNPFPGRLSVRSCPIMLLGSISLCILGRRMW